MRRYDGYDRVSLSISFSLHIKVVLKILDEWWWNPVECRQKLIRFFCWTISVGVGHFIDETYKTTKFKPHRNLALVSLFFYFSFVFCWSLLSSIPTLQLTLSITHWMNEMHRCVMMNLVMEDLRGRKAVARISFICFVVLFFPNHWFFSYTYTIYDRPLFCILIFKLREYRAVAGWRYRVCLYLWLFVL